MGQRPREGPVRMRQSRQKEQLFKKGVNITTFLNGIILRAKFPTSKPKWFYYFDHCYIVFHTHQRHNTTQSYISLTSIDIWSLNEQASTDGLWRGVKAAESLGLQWAILFLSARGHILAFDGIHSKTCLCWVQKYHLREEKLQWPRCPHHTQHWPSALNLVIITPSDRYRRSSELRELLGTPEETEARREKLNDLLILIMIACQDQVVSIVKCKGAFLHLLMNKMFQILLV